MCLLVIDIQDLLFLVPCKAELATETHYVTHVQFCLQKLHHHCDGVVENCPASFQCFDSLVWSQSVFYLPSLQILVVTLPKVRANSFMEIGFIVNICDRICENRPPC